MIKLLNSTLYIFFPAYHLHLSVKHKSGDPTTDYCNNIHCQIIGEKKIRSLDNSRESKKSARSDQSKKGKKNLKLVGLL